MNEASEAELTVSVENRKAFGDRLRLAMAGRHTQESLAEATGASISGIKKWLVGESDPRLSNVLLAAAACGVNLDWLATGVGPMRIDEASLALAAPPAQAIDHALFGAVYAAVAALYREEKARISDNDLGALAAEKYEEIAASTTDPGDRRKMIALIVTQLRKDLRAGVGTTAQGKRSA